MADRPLKARPAHRPAQPLHGSNPSDDRLAKRLSRFAVRECQWHEPGRRRDAVGQCSGCCNGRRGKLFLSWLMLALIADERRRTITRQDNATARCIVLKSVIRGGMQREGGKQAAVAAALPLSLAKMRNGGRKPGGFCLAVHILPAPRDCGAVCDINFLQFYYRLFSGALKCKLSANHRGKMMVRIQSARFAFAIEDC